MLSTFSIGTPNNKGSKIEGGAIEKEESVHESLIALVALVDQNNMQQHRLQLRPKHGNTLVKINDERTIYVTPTAKFLGGQSGECKTWPLVFQHFRPSLGAHKNVQYRRSARDAE